MAKSPQRAYESIGGIIEAAASRKASNISSVQRRHRDIEKAAVANMFCDVGDLV